MRLPNVRVNGRPYWLQNKSAAALLTCAVVLVCTAVAPWNAKALPSSLATYTFSEGAGSTIADLSGNGNDLTIGSGTWTSNGHRGSALQSNASGSTTGASVSMANPTSAITFMAWIKPTALGDATRPAVLWRDVSENTMVGIFTRRDDFGPSNVLQGNIRIGGSLQALNGGSALTVGEWSHVAITYDGNSAVLYVDGDEIASTSISGSIGPATTLNVAGDDSYSDPAAVVVDDLRIYAEALSENDIGTLMQDPDAVEQSGNSIRMSSASQAADNVDYQLNLVDMENVQSMVIDFCSNSPLAGTDCTAPAGMDTGNVDIGSGSGDWSAAPGGAPNRVELSKDTLHDSGTIALTMAGIDNPTEVGVFYARIYAYEDETNAYSSPTDLGTGEEDEPKYLAAVALAITDDIGVTLIIPEYIEFCVYDIECGDTPAIVLGQGDPPALSTSQVDSESVQFEVATNASLGVSLRIKGPTLNMGSSEIPPNCSVDSWFDPDMPRGTALTAGTAGFGVEAVVDGYIPPNTGDEDQLEPHPAYLDWDFSGSASMGDYAFFGGCGQEQGYDTEPDSEYGSTFAFSNGPLSGASGDLVFRAAISNATAAGIYQTTLQVIATGYY